MIKTSGVKYFTPLTKKFKKITNKKVYNFYFLINYANKVIKASYSSSFLDTLSLM